MCDETLLYSENQGDSRFFFSKLLEQVQNVVTLARSFRAIPTLRCLLLWGVREQDSRASSVNPRMGWAGERGAEVGVH